MNLTHNRAIITLMKEIKVQFEDFGRLHAPHDFIQNPLYCLLSRHYKLVICKTPDFLFYGDDGIEHLKYSCIRIFYTGENIRPDFKRCDYAFSCHYLATPQHCQTPLYAFYHKTIDTVKKRQPNSFRDADISLLARRKFCNFLYSNVDAKERIIFLKKLQDYKPVDSGGKVLNNIGYQIDDKHAFLRQYKFTIAFENSSSPGYTTEKIIDAYAANTIPIYRGNPVVTRDFDSRSFINCHDYHSFDEVIERVQEVDNNDALYAQYLQAPIFTEEGTQQCSYDKLLKKFEYIFSRKQIQKVASRLDPLWYSQIRILPVQDFARRLTRRMRKCYTLYVRTFR